MNRRKQVWLNRQLRDLCRNGTGSPRNVMELIDAGADVNCRDGNGVPPLMLAIGTGDCELVKTLIASGADVNARDGYGDTPLLVAARSTKVRMRHTLIVMGADVQGLCGRNGRTPLMEVAANGRDFEAGDPLLARAHINARDIEGDSALILAAEGRHRQTCLTLLKHGASLCRKDWFRGTMLPQIHDCILRLASQRTIDDFDVFAEGDVADEVLFARAEGRAWERLASNLSRFPKLYGRCMAALREACESAKRSA